MQDKYTNNSLTCSDKAGEKGLIAFPIIRDGAVYKTGSVFSTDGLPWFLSAHITSVVVTQKDQTSNTGFG
ncbi:MAG: hypothetical protein HOE90_05150 [Bacteriovoracaceae bacterium]|nr:hypothetical protein [Bacteriovoracaceae bacterium]